MTVKEFRRELGFLSDSATVVVKCENGKFVVVTEIECDSSSKVPEGADESVSMAVILVE